MSINLTERLKQGREQKQKNRAQDESKKLGYLRAGMSGIKAETGDIAGTCHRKTHLRALGIEIEQPDDSKQMMFELGFASEDITTEILALSLLPNEIMLREEAIPIEWQTVNGTKISGRPDIVICRLGETKVLLPEGSNIEIKNLGKHALWVGDADELKKTIAVVEPPIPVLGIELKSVHSMWTARDVLFGGQPKMNNLIQAAHYMWRLGLMASPVASAPTGSRDEAKAYYTSYLPYKLVYKSYSALGQSMNDWAQRLFPKKGEPLSQHLDYNDKGGIKGIKQFEIVYDMRIDSKGRVEYKLEEASDWTRTIITTQDIQRYYEYVSEMGNKKELGPRPMTIDAHGDKLNYKDCAYCVLQSTCDSHEDLGYEKWLEAVRGKCK